jgi:excisionase family DNA binding protein
MSPRTPNSARSDARSHIDPYDYTREALILALRGIQTGLESAAIAVADVPMPDGGAAENGSHVAAQPLLLTVEEAARVLGIGRTLMYSLIASGEVESVPIGRLRRVPSECLAEYVARLRAANGSRPQAA